MSINRRDLIKAGLAAGAAGLAPGSGRTQEPMIASYRRIAVEETFSFPEYFEARRRLGSGTAIGVSSDAFNDVHAKLFEVGEGRLEAMDKAGITMQVLSFYAPGVQVLPAGLAVEMAIEANDRLGEIIRRHPRRFAGMITVAPQEPDKAAQEIARASTRLGLTGVMINSHTNGEFLDDPKFMPIFEAINEYDLTLYLHPTAPPPQAAEFLHIPGFTVGWGFGVEAGTHAVRLIASGLFDRFPDMRLILGHLGEGLPLWADRMDNRYEWETGLTGARALDRLPSQYIKQNVYVATSGMNYHAQLRMAIDVMGKDHVLFATDYPMEDQREAVEAVDSAALSDEERASIYHRNAERLFRITTAD